MDGSRRLTKAKSPRSGLVNSADGRYDDDDQLTSATSADASMRVNESYHYDGNSACANIGDHTIPDNRMDADGTYAYLKIRC